MIDAQTFPFAPAPVAALAADRPYRRFLLAHAAWPAAAWLAVGLLTQALHGDLWWADRLYAWQGARWAWQNAYLTEQVIHRFGRVASLAAWFGVLAGWLVALRRPAWRHWRRPLGYLLLSTAVAVALVSALKHATAMDCPWDLQRYGGERPYIGLLAARPAWLGRADCFPAGHASAGYAWVAVYFCLLMRRSRRRWPGLAIGLGAGALFGFAQQCRGAHFLSHDVWSLAIAWFVALALYLAMARGAPGMAAAPQARSPRRPR